jgi:hypothetical protein
MEAEAGDREYGIKSLGAIERGGVESFQRILDSACDRLRAVEVKLCLDRLSRMEQDLIGMEKELDALCAELSVRTEVHGHPRR